MRRNLYSRKAEAFVQALCNLGWKEVTPRRDGERMFRLSAYHLMLRHHELGYYCVMHVDQDLHGKLHTRSIKKEEQLRTKFREIIREYEKMEDLETNQTVPVWWNGRVVDFITREKAERITRQNPDNARFIKYKSAEGEKEGLLITTPVPQWRTL